MHNHHHRKPGSQAESHFAVLEVATDASPADIKAAYRRLAMRWHPDKRAGDTVAEERFKRIMHAYEVLSDPLRRQAYESAEGIRAINSSPRVAPRAQSSHTNRKMRVAGVVLSTAAVAAIGVYYVAYRDNQDNAWQAQANVTSPTSTPAPVVEATAPAPESPQLVDVSSNANEALSPEPKVIHTSLAAHGDHPFRQASAAEIVPSEPMASRPAQTQQTEPADLKGIAAKDWYEAGMRYYEGRDGVSQNYAEAARYFRRAAAQNHAGAQTLLGVMYAQGLGVPQDPEESLRWYNLVKQSGAQTR